MAGAMQGRRGADSLSNTLVVAGIVCLVLSVLPHMGLFSWPALALLAMRSSAPIRRTSLRAIARTRRSCARLRNLVRALSIGRKKWENRETTLYFKCKAAAGAFGPAWQGNASRGVPKVQDRNRKEIVAAHVRLHHGR